MRIVHYTYPQSRNLAPAFNHSGRNPWSGLESEMDRWFESTLTALAAPHDQRFPVDLFEDKDNTYIRAELPGVNRDDIKVEMVEGFLTIQASRKSPAGGNEESATFSRSVNIPDGVHDERVKAAYENGVLTVTLPKREETKPRKIAVSVN